MKVARHLDKEKVEQIFKMMDYLGKTYESTATRWRKGNGATFLAEDRTIRDPEKILAFDVDNLHRKLVKLCGNKAQQRWIDIELANNNLFWCCHE